jgi:glutamyl-tRNA synthetase
MVKDATALLKDRMQTLSEAPELMRYFLLDELDAYDPALLIPKKAEPAETVRALEATLAALDEVDLADEAAVEARLRALAEELGVKAGQLFMPIRVAVTGRKESPGLFETLRVVGAARVRARISVAIALLRSTDGAAG